jgi:hypothetical protein
MLLIICIFPHSCMRSDPSVTRMLCILRGFFAWRQPIYIIFFDGPRSKCYGRTAALRLIVQPCDEDD